MDRQAWDERYTGEALLWSAEPNRFLIGEVDGLEPGRALDLACGEGRNAVWLAQHGWEVTGVDFSAVALQKARGLTETLRVDVSWVLADVVEYVPTPAGYDLVLVFYLHLPADQRRRAFARAATAVDPGGTLLIVGHDSTNLTAGWGGPRDPAVLYTPDDVIGDIGDLEVIKAGRVERQVTTSDGPRTAIDLLVRATRPV